MNVLDALTFAVLAAVAVRLVAGARIALRPSGREHVLAIVRGLRPRHFLFAPFVFTLVVTAILLLFQIPGLDIGWWTAIGGTGNPVTGGTDRTAGTALEWVIPLAFFAVLLPALPLFAEAEERIFRSGSESRSFWGRAGKGVQFGMVHAIVGIPIGAALALSIGGWYFTWMYLREYQRPGGDAVTALAESTRAHLAYNIEILVLAVLALTVLA